MAFVTATPLTLSSRTSASLLTNEITSTKPLREQSTGITTLKSTTPRMGYGAYTYTTDKTKGHVNQYYVDKFRNASDFAKGSPACLADSLVGRTPKGGVVVPTKGIPQLEDTPEIPIIAGVEPDPRLAETEGSVYSWDAQFINPDFLPSTFADVNDEEVADMALAQYRGMVSSERNASLTAMDFGAVERVKKLTSGEGLTEKYMLTLDGQLDVEYVKLQKLGYPPSFNPTGIPQTEIPGYDYLPSVGALDAIMTKDVDNVAFWASRSDQLEAPYKTPAGNDMPELPYNTSASAGEMKLVQEARDIIPKSD